MHKFILKGGESSMCQEMVNIFIKAVGVRQVAARIFASTGGWPWPLGVKPTQKIKYWCWCTGYKIADVVPDVVLSQVLCLIFQIPNFCGKICLRGLIAVMKSSGNLSRYCIEASVELFMKSFLLLDLYSLLKYLKSGKTKVFWLRNIYWFYQHCCIDYLLYVCLSLCV